MRFLADGPSIPVELLIARDDGRVVFFCGAGVSRAHAGLPNFFELAHQVLAALARSRRPARVAFACIQASSLYYVVT